MSGLSLRHKLIATIVLTAMVSLLVALVATLFYNLQVYRQSLFNDLNLQAALISRASAPALQFDDPDSANEYLGLMEERPLIEAAAIYNARGSLFASYYREGVESASIPKLPELDGGRIQGDAVVLFKRIVVNDEILGTVYLRVQYRLYQTLLVNLGIALAVFCVALAVALAMSFWLQSSVTRPILSVTELAKKVVERRDYSMRAERTTKDEIGYLVDSVNALLSEVESRNQALEDSNEKLAAQIQERLEADRALRESEQRVLQLNAELELRVEERTLQLENSNRELEAFSYSVSHDLRTPLRAIDGFSLALLEDYDQKLDDTGRDYLARVRAGAQRMGVLIDDMLKLSRVTRAEFRQEEVNLSEIAEGIMRELHDAEPDRVVDFRLTSGLVACCDPHLMRIALHNLLGNAWKYSQKCEKCRIEFGMRQQHGSAVYFIQDNGAGFDMTYANKLFGAFQRLHDASEFSGTGIGLATVKRIISRHGGRVWAEAKINMGATFYFTLPSINPARVLPVNSLEESANVRSTNTAG